MKWFWLKGNFLESTWMPSKEWASSKKSMTVAKMIGDRIVFLSIARIKAGLIISVVPS